MYLPNFTANRPLAVQIFRCELKCRTDFILFQWKWTPLRFEAVSQRLNKQFDGITFEHQTKEKYHWQVTHTLHTPGRLRRKQSVICELFSDCLCVMPNVFLEKLNPCGYTYQEYAPNAPHPSHLGPPPTQPLAPTKQEQRLSFLICCLCPSPKIHLARLQLRRYISTRSHTWRKDERRSGARGRGREMTRTYLMDARLESRRVEIHPSPFSLLCVCCVRGRVKDTSHITLRIKKSL